MEEKNFNFDTDKMGADALGEGFEAIASLLALKEEQFKLVAPVFLDEFERALNDPAQEKEFLDSLVGSVGAGSVDKTIKQYTLFIQEIEADNDFTDFHKDFFRRFFMILTSHLSNYDPHAQQAVAIPIELCHKNSKMPVYARKGDAGLDLYAMEDLEFAPGQTQIISTGVKMAIPEGYEIQIRPKSGISAKTNWRVSLGTIDSGYRGELGVIMTYDTPAIQDITYHYDDNNKLIIDSILHAPTGYISAGQKIAQIVLNKIEMANFYEVSDISTIAGDRGGGFGSTGV